MREKLKELSEILKQKPEIKKRLERLEFGCWCYFPSNSTYVRYFEHDFIFINNRDYEIIGHEPAYHDILEFLGKDWMLHSYFLFNNEHIDIKLSPGPLYEQSDETLDKIILLCKDKKGKQ